MTMMRMLKMLTTGCNVAAFGSIFALSSALFLPHVSLVHIYITLDIHIYTYTIDIHIHRYANTIDIHIHIYN